MAALWVRNEMKTADLKDKRLNERLQRVLGQLAGCPTASIPTACGGHAEMTAADRLFDNEKATFEQILAPHAEATRQRMARQEVALLVQDTTEVDVTRPLQQVHGAGPLDGQARRGALLHLLHAFVPDGTPLGSLYGRPWVRGEQAKNASLSRAARAAIPIEQKESHRWVETLRRAGAESAHCPATRLVCLADSEADIYEVLAEATAEPRRVDWIVRACRKRALPRRLAAKSGARHVREHVPAQPALFSDTLQVRGRKAKVSCETRGRRRPREARETEVAARAARVRLAAPWRSDRRLPEVSVNAVLVRELAAPEGEEPLEWLLLTSLPVETVAQVRQVIQYYGTRWMIEVFFRVLKSGCRVEERRFEHMGRLLSCLAVYLIVAWRALYVCRLGRGCPERDCETLFEPAEWQAVWKVVQRRDPPRRPPALGVMIRQVAQLGGYVNRNHRGPPGPQTVWIGLQRRHDFAICWRLFGPAAREGPQLV